MIQLRNYQETAVSNTIDSLWDNPILVSPTGSGKTVMATSIMSLLPVKALWLAHRTELIEQASRTIWNADIQNGIIKANHPENGFADTQVASVQTLVNRMERLPEAELIIIDECHHAVGNSYQKIVDAYPGIPRIGLTATPYRLDGRGLGEIFGKIVVSATSKELIEQGYLHKPTAYCCSLPDMKGIRKTAGDYNLKQLDQAINQASLIGNIVEEWEKKAKNKKTVVFAVSVDHSRNICDEFNKAGYRAEHIDGSTGKGKREDILQWLRDGTIDIVSNCMVLTEGWDLPALECAIIARPTASLCLHLQMIGRIMRACDDKEGAIVLDHAGNHHRHGCVTRDIEYSLDGLPKKKKGEPLGVRMCPECFVFQDSGIEQCDNCGYVFTDMREIVYEMGELELFDEDSFEYKAGLWEQFEDERLAAGYQRGQAKYRYFERFGVWPAVVYGDDAGRLINTKRPTKADKQAIFDELDAVRQNKNFSPGWTSHKYRDVFGVWPRGLDRRNDNNNLARTLNQKWQLKNKYRMTS